MAELVVAWLRRTGTVALANPVAMVTAIGVGAIAAFAYSYIPLHGAKDWQIDYLEARVDQQALRIEELEASVASAKALAESRPDPGVVEPLQAELKQAQAKVQKLARETERANARIRSLTRSRDDWKSRYAALEEQQAIGNEEPEAFAASDPAEPSADETGFVDEPEGESVVGFPGAARPEF